MFVETAGVRVGAPWLGVEFRHLAALDAIAQEGSFRGAAQRLGYVQSAVSQQISYLERVVGERLVDRCRGQKQVTLSPAGELLLGHGLSILAQLEAARADLASLEGEERRGFRVAIAASLTRVLTPRVIGALGQVLTGAVQWVDPARETALADLVERGDVDLAVGEIPRGEALQCRPLLKDPYLLVVPRCSPLAETTGPVDLADLHEQSLVAPLAAQGLAHAELQLRVHDIRVASTVRAVSLTTIQALVGRGVGAAVLPRLSVDASDDTIVALPLDDVLPARPIGIFWHAKRRQNERFGAVCDAVQRTSRDLSDAVAVNDFDRQLRPAA